MVKSKYIIMGKLCPEKTKEIKEGCVNYMGGSYFVPRSVKGESRILYIFSMKSFIVTLISGLIGAAIWYIVVKAGGSMGTIPGLILVGVFGLLGFGLSTIVIPDSPMMGPLRKAGGENVGEMLLRLITFRRKKKIYMYNLKRDTIRGGKTNER